MSFRQYIDHTHRIEILLHIAVQHQIGIAQRVIADREVRLTGYDAIGFLPNPPFPNTHGRGTFFRHYVLFPAHSFGQIQQRKTENLPRPPCHQRRVAFADPHGAADLLGDDDAAEIVDAANDTGGFHDRTPPVS